jgi:hypothetical protein
VAEPQNLADEDERPWGEARAWGQTELDRALDGIRVLLADAVAHGYPVSCMVFRPPILLPRRPGDKGDTHARGNLRIEIEVETPRRVR